MADFGKHVPAAGVMLALLSACLFMLTACERHVKAVPESRLQQMSPSDVKSMEWKDDLNYRGLDRAVEQSIRYYRRLSPEHIFRYEEMEYAPGDMIASLQLFMDIIRHTPEPEIAGELRQKFLFFESLNSEQETLFTGYYEPLLDGRSVPSEGFTEPLYRTPPDLVEVELGRFDFEWEGERIVGKLEDGRLVPYDSRGEIVYNDSLEGRAEPIAYVNDVELFFLQIQGSGLVRFPDGRVKRVNYAQKNGHPYRSIGRLLQERLPPDQMSLQSIKKFLNDHPEEKQRILSHNQSYVFFREVEEGPLGYIEVPLTPRRSIAMDRMLVPRGGLAFIKTELPVFENDAFSGWKPAARFALVQDTGSAITGHGRVDLFMGSGREAERVAGYMKRRGRCFLIVAKKEYLY